VAALAGLDAHWGARTVISATVVIGPFVTSLFGSTRQTALVAVVAIAVCTASGEWNENWWSDAYLVRLLVVIVGAGFAVLSARGRVRLGVDRDRFRILTRAAQISDIAGGAVGETVQRLGELVVPALADVCVIDVLRGDGVERLAVVATGPRAEWIEAGVRGRVPGTEDVALRDRLAALHAGEATLVRRIDDAYLDAAARDPADRAFLGQLGARSVMSVPLRARGRTIGGMVLLATADSARTYGDDELAFAQVLSGRVALALDNAGLFSELESLEAQQTAALGSLAEAVTIERAGGELVYANEAAARALGYASSQELAEASGDRVLDRFETFTEDGVAVRPQDLPGRRVLAGEHPGPLLVRAVHRETGEERWRVLKSTAVLDRDARPHLSVNVLEDVTDVKRTELAQRFLAQAGELLSSSLDPEETLTRVARLVVPQLADWCQINLPDERGVLRSVAIAHSDPDKVAFAEGFNCRHPSRITDPGGAAAVLRSGEPRLVNEIPDALLEEAVDDPHAREELRRIGMQAVMIVPMVAARGPIGTITFVSAESGRRFSAADLALAQELGRRAGTAVENARLYTERSHIARTLQASLLPDALPELPGFAVASMYRPAGTETFVGGDFYDAFETAQGWMLLIGDVTGRGAEAAALTAQARHTLRIAATLLGDPAAAIRQLNRGLADKSELSICTVAMVLLRRRDGRATATVLCAGHPPALLVRDGSAQPVGRPGPVVGAWEDSTWPTETIELSAGDLVVLYTDGVTDATRDEERFGAERLAACLAGVGEPAEAVEAIRSAVVAFEEGAQADDTALLAAQWLGSGSSPPSSA
jgi:serine phosphatase RsbU (regulator of sigma subunit)/PAS domain-containing protein